MPSLYFDGDKRRIYEVPDLSSYVTDGNGYRVYTPDDIPSAPEQIEFSAFDLWSRAVDFMNANKWALAVFDLKGGAFRYTDGLGADVYALPDIRLINGWAYVPADYKHKTLLIGNIYPNVADGLDFDTDRITAQGVSPRIQFNDRGERSIIAGSGNAPTAQENAAAVWGYDPDA